MKQRWAWVTEVLDGAARRPDARERARYLREACAADPELRREVEHLLAFEQADGGILDGPLLAADEDDPKKKNVPPPALDPGQEIGPYRVERILGDGGMGVVALAYDPALERRVALKLIRREMVSDELLRRFATERRVLARLDHPHIARIFDAGRHGDLPYFAMEHVDGEPIDTYCDRRRLPVEARLRLVLEICDALGETHRNLVVHRDLKPGNVLVITPSDPKQLGEPKLLDFGIAKELTSTADATRTGHQPLTPAYASPEQVRGRPVGVATDVYSLGVLLYRLLCGHPPYVLDGDSYENARKICEDEPPLPSTRAVLAREVWQDGSPTLVPPDVLARDRSSEPNVLRRQLRGDLDAIVAKALAKDPRERYRSMEAFADDLRRHLNGLPVDARQSTAGYRGAKFLRRHRWRVAAAAVVVASLLGGGASWYVSQEERRRSAEQAEQAERRAEAVNSFARNLVLTADPDASGDGRVTSRELLERGDQQARRTLADEPESLAHQLEAIGLSYQALGDLDAARGALEESLRLRQRVYEGDHRLVARGLNNLAALLHMADERGRAESLYRRALDMKRRLGQPAEDLVRVENNLASLLAFRGEYEEAEALYLRVLETRRQALGDDDVRLATSLRSLGNLYYLRGDFADAEARLREALRLREREYGPESRRVASVLSLLGRVLHARGRQDEAEDVLRRALDVRVARLGEDHLHVALSRKDLASLYFDAGNEEQAEELWAQALAVLRAKKPPDSWEIADAESQIGGRLAVQGRFEEAEPLLTRSYEILRRVCGERSVYARRARERLEDLRRRSPAW